MDEFPAARNPPPAHSRVRNPTTTLITRHFSKKTRSKRERERFLQKIGKLPPIAGAKINPSVGKSNY
jgi:hypothetical protein